MDIRESCIRVRVHAYTHLSNWTPKVRVLEKNQYGYDTQQLAAQLYSSDLESKCLHSMFSPI